MSKKTLIATAVGAAFIAGMSTAPVALAAENPFALSGMSSGYQVADNHAAKSAEGKCGGMKAAADGKMKDGKCGEGKCGGDKAKSKAMEGKCGGDKAKAMEGKCGGDKAKAAEGKCGGMKK